MILIHIFSVLQDLFRQSHPVHYLNSKAQGVGVALTTPAINKAQSMYRYVQRSSYCHEYKLALELLSLYIAVVYNIRISRSLQFDL